MVVTGIAPNTDLGAVEAALRQAGLALDPLQVVTTEDPALGGVRAPLESGDSIFGTTGTGTGVPGLTSASPKPAPRPAFNQELLDRLAALEIPDDRIANYAEALEAGRSVVAYFAKPANVEAVTAAFRAAGLAKITTF